MEWKIRDKERYYVGVVFWKKFMMIFFIEVN